MLVAEKAGAGRLLVLYNEGEGRFRPVVVAWRSGAPVRLEELGTVADSVEDTKLIAWFNDVRGVILGIPGPAELARIRKATEVQSV